MLTALLVIALVDLGLTGWTLLRQIQTERRLEAAIKHPVRVHGPVK